MKRGINSLLVFTVFSLLFGMFLVEGVSALTLISDCIELQDIQNDLTEDYYLTMNIDCSATSGWNRGAGFDPIGENVGGWFEGTLDGKGFVIDGLYTTMGSGLFAATLWGAEIKNVGLTNVDITGTVGVGAFTGNNFGDISNCYATGSIVSDENVAGMLVGFNGGTITNCYSSGTVNGVSDDIGGLVGDNGGDIINSYSVVSVAEDGEAGGGGLVGMNSGTCTNSFWNPTDASPATESDCGIESTQTDMKEQATFTNWDFVNIWDIQEDVTYPYLNFICPSDQIIMKLFQPTNSHGALWDDTNYIYDICYSDIFGVAYAGASPHACSGTNKVLGLFDVSNSHAEIPSLDNYAVDVCYGDLVCEADSSAGNGCINGGEVVVRLFGDTNSHISDASDTNYLTKICCKQREVIPTGNVYWTDMQGNPIISAEIGDSVLMIYQDMAGQDYDFEIFENDRLLDDYIRSVTESFDFGADLAAKWVITQEDWEKDIISDPEFVFIVDDITSGNLIVPEDSFDNAPPLTQIIKPIAETNYVIRQGQATTNIISFEQISSDVDDDLELIWKFGGSESASFDNCLSGTNCNTTHQYAASGTKNIILSVSEMTPRTPTQYVKDYSRIYVYNIGVTAFVVMDEVVTGRLVEIDATQTHVSDCDYLQATCEGKYGAGNCYQIIDSIDLLESIWCYDLTLRVDGIDINPNLFLDWTIDGVAFTPNRVGSGMKYIKIFNEPGEHIINLNVRYKL